MGMTMTQKILAAHAGLDSVQAGQLINAKLDMVLGNDITSPVAINEFKKAGFTSVFDKEKISLVMDHFVPNKDIKAAEQSKQCREFAGEMGITNFYDVGNMGVEHALLPEKGLVGPANASSARIRIPAPTALWARFPPASALRIWRPAWPRARHGLKCRARFALS